MWDNVILLCIEPTENLADVPEDQVVETIETSDGPVASTVDHVHEIAKDVSCVCVCVCVEIDWVGGVKDT